MGNEVVIKNGDLIPEEHARQVIGRKIFEDLYKILYNQKFQCRHDQKYVCPKCRDEISLVKFTALKNEIEQLRQEYLNK